MLVAGLTLNEFVSTADHETMVMIQSASAGLLLYVITGHLLRTLEDQPSFLKGGALSVGLFVGFSLNVLFGVDPHPTHSGPDFRPQVYEINEVNHAFP